jgi:hypothetical protein
MSPLMRKFLIVFSLLIDLISITSCTEKTMQPTVDANNIVTPYPIYTPDYSSQTEKKSGYPISNQTDELKDYYPEQLEIPQPGTQTGIVVGRLLYNATDKPYLAPGIYLGKEISNKDSSNSSVPSVISISPSSDPLATQAQDGSFMFTNVEPGEYRLFLWSPMSLVLVKDVNTSEEIIIIVSAGKITDLGDIVIQ